MIVARTLTTFKKINRFLPTMDLKSLVLAVGATFGYVGTADGARITKAEQYTDYPHIGHVTTYQRYTIRSARGDTLESIAAQITEQGISGFEGTSYTPEMIHQAVLGQLQFRYLGDPQAVLPRRTTLHYDRTVHVRRGFHLNL